MAFYVTPSFTIVDTEGTFSNLSNEEKVDLLYNGRDIWENNNGQWRGPSSLPKVVVMAVDPDDTYGTVEP